MRVSWTLIGATVVVAAASGWPGWVGPARRQAPTGLRIIESPGPAAGAGVTVESLGVGPEPPTRKYRPAGMSGLRGRMNSTAAGSWPATRAARRSGTPARRAGPMAWRPSATARGTTCIWCPTAFSRSARTRIRPPTGRARQLVSRSSTDREYERRRVRPPGGVFRGANESAGESWAPGRRSGSSRASSGSSPAATNLELDVLGVVRRRLDAGGITPCIWVTAAARR